MCNVYGIVQVKCFVFIFFFFNHTVFKTNCPNSKFKEYQNKLLEVLLRPDECVKRSYQYKYLCHLYNYGLRINPTNKVWNKRPQKSHENSKYQFWNKII